MAYEPGGLGGAAMSLALQVATGLAFVHANGVIHRDLKPSNVFLGRGSSTQLAGAAPSVKIGDFGLARLQWDSRVGEAPRDAAMTTMVGSPAYMAPEVIAGSCDYTEKADLFSYALLMWGMWAGARPHEAEQPTVQALARAVVGGERLGPPRNCPAEVARIMAHCWAPDPKARPQFAHVAKELAALQAAATKRGGGGGGGGGSGGTVEFKTNPMREPKLAGPPLDYITNPMGAPGGGTLASIEHRSQARML